MMTERRLSILGYALAAVIIVGFAIHAGIFRPFTQVYDADLHYLYRALRFNSGLEQKYFDNIGYLNTLILSWWLKAAHLLGFIPGATLEQVRGAAAPGQAMASAIYAARIHSLLLVLLFIAVIGYGCARLSGSRLFGSAAALLVAPTSGVAYHAITIRPELVSSLALSAAYLAVLFSVNKGERQRLLLLGLASGFAYLSFLTKMQAIIPLLFLPLTALVCPPAKQVGAGTKKMDLDTACLFLFAIVLFLPFAVSHYFGATELRRQSFPSYSWAIVVYTLGSLAAYGLIYRQPLAATVRAMSAVMIGLGTAFCVNYFNFSHSASAVNASFLDNLWLYGGGNKSANTSFAGFEGYAELFSVYVDRLRHVLPAFFKFNNAERVVHMVTALVALSSAIVVWRRGNSRAGLQILILLAAYFGTRTVFQFRGIPAYYEPYLVLFPPLALSLGFAAVGGAEWVRTHRRSVAPIMTLVLLVAVWEIGQMKYQASAQTPHISARNFCEWQGVWAPILPDGAYTGDRCWKTYASALDEQFVASLRFHR